MAISVENLQTSILVEGKWIDKLFDDFALFPVIGDDEHTKNLLVEEPVAKKLTGLILKKANVAALVDSLTGINLLSRARDGGVLSEAYDEINKHREIHQTIKDKIGRHQKLISKAGMLFSLIKEGEDYLRKSSEGSSNHGSIYSNISKIDRKLVSVTGILCRVENTLTVKNARIGKALVGSNIQWVLADFPCVAMGQPAFRHGVVLLQLHTQIVEQIEEDLPFCKETGWYPYVRVVGTCLYPYSPRYGFPSISPSWIQYRTPKSPHDIVNFLHDVYFNKQVIKNSGTNLDKENPLEILVYADLLKILARSVNLAVPDLHELRDIVEDISSREQEAKRLLLQEGTEAG